MELDRPFNSRGALEGRKVTSMELAVIQVQRHYLGRDNGQALREGMRGSKRRSTALQGEIRPHQQGISWWLQARPIVDYIDREEVSEFMS